MRNNVIHRSRNGREKRWERVEAGIQEKNSWLFISRKLLIIMGMDELRVLHKNKVGDVS